MTENGSHSASELLAVMSSRVLEDGQTVFAGVGIPLLAATLAQRIHAPGLTILFEGGVLGPFIVPGELPPSTNEQRCTRQANMVLSNTDVLLLLQRGYVDIGFMGGAQIEENAFGCRYARSAGLRHPLRYGGGRWGPAQRWSCDRCRDGLGLFVAEGQSGPEKGPALEQTAVDACIRRVAALPAWRQVGCRCDRDAGRQGDRGRRLHSVGWCACEQWSARPCAMAGSP